MYDFLKMVPMFADLPPEDLERLCEMVDEVHLNPGEILFEEGSPGDLAYVIKEGELEILKLSSGREVLLAVRNVGEVIGEMALIQDSTRNATVRATGETWLIAIHKAQFNNLLNTSSTAARAMLNTFVSRLNATGVLLRQSEKMAQLGTLTAGVAHELNNPAAAVKRGADQLRQTLVELGKSFSEMSDITLTAEQKQVLVELEEAAQKSALRTPVMDAMVRSDLEFDLETWLDAQGVPDAWDLAPVLVDLEYDIVKLENVAGQFSHDALPQVIGWLGKNYQVYNLLTEIDSGAGRISSIVKALKSYSYLDQAPVQAVDVHEGLDNTLLILRSKLKKGINVRREYADPIPKIQAYGSELNQVWTNILDNAIDALEGTKDPEIIISTRWEGDWLIVELADNGPGIPADIQAKIFDPFFTTKPPGKGTGLGLNISYNIITQKHHGDIRVFSKPGRTAFEVWLPVELESGERGAPPPVAGYSKVSDARIETIIMEAKKVAVVGLSRQTHRPAHTVPKYLLDNGFDIIPVNPNFDEIFGLKSYANIKEIPEEVDIVQIFRPSEEALGIVEDAISIGAHVIWMQEGVVNNMAAAEARKAGLEVVMDTCMRVTHKRLLAKQKKSE